MSYITRLIDKFEAREPLVHIEHALRLPFGSLKKIREAGECDQETLALLTMVWNFPWLLTVARNDFKLPVPFTEVHMDLNKHPILMECYEVMQAIEECGASPQATNAVVKAGHLLDHLKDLVHEWFIRPEPDLSELRYTVSAEKYDYALNAISRSMHPSVEFRENLDEMRDEAREVSRKNIHDAYDVLTRLISNKE